MGPKSREKRQSAKGVNWRGGEGTVRKIMVWKGKTGQERLSRKRGRVWRGKACTAAREEHWTKHWA